MLSTLALYLSFDEDAIMIYIDMRDNFTFNSANLSIELREARPTTMLIVYKEIFTLRMPYHARFPTFHATLPYRPQPSPSASCLYIHIARYFHLRCIWLSRWLMRYSLILSRHIFIFYSYTALLRLRAFGHIYRLPPQIAYAWATKASHRRRQSIWVYSRPRTLLSPAMHRDEFSDDIASTSRHAIMLSMLLASCLILRICVYIIYLWCGRDKRFSDVIPQQCYDAFRLLER